MCYLGGVIGGKAAFSELMQNRTWLEVTNEQLIAGLEEGKINVVAAANHGALTRQLCCHAMLNNTNRFSFHLFTRYYQNLSMW